MLASASIAFAFFIPTFAPSIDDTLPDKADVRFRYQIIELTNLARAKDGLPPLKAASDLMDISQGHAADMATKNYFDHTSQDGRTPADRVKPFATNAYTGENISAGQANPTAAMNSWLKSNNHYQNLMSPNYREIGVGYAGNNASDYKRYWVQNFCGRDSAWPVIINNEGFETKSPEVSLHIHRPGDATRIRVRNDDQPFGDWRQIREKIDWRLANGPGVKRVEVEIEFEDGQTFRSHDTIRYKL